MQTKKTLILNKICPFAQRVWLTLQQKQIPYDLHQVSLDKKQPYFTQTYKKAFAHDPSSDGKVPILIDDDKIITQSDLISWYLAQNYHTGTQLIPQSAYDRLRMRYIIQLNTKFIVSFYGFKGYKSKSKQDQQKHMNTVYASLKTIQQNITLPYIMGINFTLADILIIPWFFRSCIFEKLFDITIHSQFPKIISWINNVSERNSAKVTKQACQFYNDGYQSYFN